MTPKLSIITAFLGQTRDRFSEYQENRTLEQKMAMVKQLKGCTGVEMVFPYEINDAAKDKKMLADAGLQFAAVNVNIKREPMWVPGALTRPDKEIRAKAVQFIKDAKDYAKQVGAPLVTCCPLSDGYDLLFQVDYRKAWRNMIEAVAEAAEYRPEIPLYLEPKYSETRVHCSLDTTARGLLLLKEVGNPATGITLDFGHALQSQENPAQSLVNIVEAGFGAYLHTNDNDTRFDWDLHGGARHFLQFVEFIFWAQEIGYDKFFTTDASPRIFDMAGFFNRHSEFLLGVWRLVEGLNRQKYFDLMQKEDAPELMRLVNREIYRLE
jgi:xylose isomerase